MNLSSRRRSIREIDARQRNILLPDTLRNAALVDAFLWKGSPDATYVQRIGMGLFGLVLLCPGALLVSFGCSRGDPLAFRFLMFLLALPWVAIACKLLRNAFRHRTQKR